MNRFFRSILYLLAGVLIFWLPFLYSCTRSEPVSSTDVIPISTENKYLWEKPTADISYDEIPLNSRKASVYEVQYNIIIPGRSMKSAEFTPGEESTIDLDGASLYVPAGGLNRKITLSVTGLSGADLPPLPGEIVNVTGNCYTGYRFLPHGMIFDSAATVAIAYDEALIPDGFTTEDIYTWYFDDSDSKWKALSRDSVDRESGLVVSGTFHFTDMINGIIRIPESPETEGFIPTSVKDIKAADPGAGITFIEPPVAINTGEAILSYPFKLPAGRSGMQPQLNLQYSSDGGSGWTGYGWSLDIPSVSVDPTWGVPRYLTDKESETYIFGGSQLTPVAHRGEYADRTPEKRFYPRVEGSFSKIVRHGNNPADYWWEVTTKEGMRNFYGGLPGSGIISTAVSSDAAGNIGYWALTETRDLHGNFISYKYDRPAGSAQQIYIREITYTGHGTEEGPYKISFIRDDEGNTYQRKDARINATYGFIQRDNELLRYVDVTFNDEPLRSYVFRYEDGEFLKSLLAGISEINAAGEEFYSHSFEYYDDVRPDDKYVPYGNDEIWDLPDDNLKELFLNPVNFFFDNVSALGGSGSSGFSGGVSGTVGLLDGNLSTKDMTAGGNASFQSSENEGFLTVVDLNGDGLPDKVYKKNNKVYYRPNLLSYPSDEMFGDAKLITGIDKISLSKTIGFGGGVEANPYRLYFGSDFTSATTKTSAYFSDFNADGLIDLVSNNVVYFNHLDDNGVPVFSASSGETPNPLLANSNIDQSILPDPAEEQAQLEAQFPLHDAVRMWQAPFDGLITLNAPVQLIEDTSAVAMEDSYKDGVKVSIQLNGSTLWSTIIDAGNYSLVPGPGLSPVNILKGDRIYFRVQSRFNGSYDKVFWDPEIEYLAINGSDTLVNLEDSNGKIVGKYEASEDFVLCGNQNVGLPKDGEIRIRASFTKPVTSDSLELIIGYTDSLGINSRIFYSSYDCGSTVTDSIDFYYEVIRNGFLQFSVVSNTNVDWSRIKFTPLVEYTRIDNDSIPLKDYNGNLMLTFRAVPDYTVMYNDPVRQEFPVIADSSFIASFKLDSIDVNYYQMKVTPGLTSISNINPADTIGFILSVKQKHNILDEEEYNCLNGATLTPDTLIVPVRPGDTLYVEYYFTDNDVLTLSDTAYVIVGADSLNRFKASVFSPVNPEDAIFGHLYRGWGQFDYRGDSTRATSSIDESLLLLSDNGNVDVASIQDTSSLSGIKNPMGGVFNIMIPYAATGSYLGTDNEVYVLPEYISSSRMGEKNVFVEPLVISASGLNAVTKVATSSSKSVAGGLSVLSYSHSWGDDNLTVDMMDMNGDRYPDLLSTNSIQYTGVQGVLSGSAVNHSLGDHYSVSEAWGISGGGTFANAKSSNSLTPVPTKGVKVIIGNNFKTNNNSREAEETSESSFGVSGSFTDNDDYTDQTWLDINGDGLPDKVYDNGTVRLNLGYSFAPAETWNFDAICVGKSVDFGGGLGINISNGSIIAGVGISKTFNYATETFLDINADGLPDMVKGSNVYFNSGAGFASPVEWPGLDGDWPGSVPIEMVGAIPLEAGEAIGESANAGFTIGIAIPIFFIKICINPSASVNHGVSRALTQLADINGDGMPDFLLSGNEDELKVKPSTIFRTNILKRVERPMGGSFTLDYLLTPAVYDHPGGKLALASVEMYDGLAGDGVDTSLITFEYEGGYYDRHEREFYGFASVVTHIHNTSDNNSIYRSLVQRFSNSDYYTKGIMLSETLTDGEGHNQKGSENIYSLKDIHTGESLPGSYSQSDRAPAFVALDETKQYYYAGATQPLLSTRVTYDYDTLGNISSYTDYSSGNDNAMYSVSVRYHGNNDKYLYSVPSSQEVYTIDGLKRKNETVIDEFGDITRISQYISNEEIAMVDMEYDEFGNLIKITRPANYNGERLWYEYEYDQAVHSYVTNVTDAYGYSSSASYDYKWGMPVEVTDMNDQEMEYSFDDCGRMTTITGPYEMAEGRPYTISFEYFPEADIPYSHTMHYDSVYDSNIETYTFSDGLGRPVQIKKTASIFEDANIEDRPGFIVSGRIMYDAFGRATVSYQPVLESEGDPATYNDTPDNVQPALTDYDMLDRIRKVVLPDGSVTTHRYNISDFNGETVHTDSLTDALNNISVTYTKANGKQAAIARRAASGDIITRFGYNGIGELMTVTDPMGNISKSEYDMLGRRIAFDQPDAGLTEFAYDAAGNIIKKVTANLRKQIPDGGAITYKYDRERLVEIVYPRNIQNRVNYTYGEPGAPFNRAGRIVLQQDASGGQEFFYSKLGEIIKTIRTVQIGESDMRTWIWSAEYDTWNRVQSMTYPDGEKVTYYYNRAGNLLRMEGEKLGQSYTYISRIGYNKYENQVYIRYGNGSETSYDFEPKLQRLKQMNVSSGGVLIMDNEYSYDLTGNILALTNSAGASGTIGGSTSHTYSYDELYRLTGAGGEFSGKNNQESYSLTLEYDIMGKILQKEQQQMKNNEVQSASTYSLSYKYQGQQPNTATEIGGRVFSYDANGNLTSWQDTVTNDYRQLAWDEENRLTLISDNGYMNRYVYDASDERVIKSHGGMQGVYLNGAPAGIVNHSDDNYTVYVSPYFVFHNEKFTKHYYNGITRIASKTGNGQFMNLYRPSVFEITAGGVNYINRQQQLESEKNEYVGQSHVPPGPPSMKGVYADPLYTGTAYPDAGTPVNDPPRGWPKKPVFAPPGGPPGAPVQWSEDVTNENVNPGFGFTGNGNFKESLEYFYHTDHLGSTSYITNAGGEVTQFIAYLPFGETFTEQHSDWDSPYKFNAKEIDNETGLYYYGARYYDPKVSLWLGVDPLVEEYTGTSPYVYCLDNPVKYLDPDGKKIILMGDQLQKKRLLEIYQKLSDDRLDYNVKTGEVYGFSATNLSKGPKTAQIRDMLNQKGVVRVVLDNTNGSRMEFNPDELTNATNNTGIGSCTIFLNPGEKMELLVKDNTGRLKFMESPIERTAAHENSHALRAMKGIFRNPYEMVKHDPDWRIPGGGKIRLEEMENMMEENRLFPEAERVRYTPRGKNESLPKSKKVNRQR